MNIVLLSVDRSFNDGSSTRSRSVRLRPVGQSNHRKVYRELEIEVSLFMYRQVTYLLRKSVQALARKQNKTG